MAASSCKMLQTARKMDRTGNHSKTDTENPQAIADPFNSHKWDVGQSWSCYQMVGRHHTRGVLGQAPHRFPSRNPRVAPAVWPSLLLVHNLTQDRIMSAFVWSIWTLLFKKMVRSQVIHLVKARFWVRSGRAPHQKNASPLTRRWGAAFVRVFFVVVFAPQMPHWLETTRPSDGPALVQKHQPGIGLIRFDSSCRLGSSRRSTTCKFAQFVLRVCILIQWKS